MTDIMTGLTTGMIDGLPAPPIAALAFQWNRQAPHMLDIGLAPIVGGTVISTRTWNRIAPADRAAVSEIALAAETRLRAEVPNQDRFAVALMSKQGLTVTKAEGPEWKAEANALARAMRGGMVPADIFDLALKERDAFRQRKAAGASR
jgi:TRAP-type transport system periplasmic protein